MWPAAYAEYRLPVTLPITVAIFSILVYLIAQTKVVRQMMAIADPYFDTSDGDRIRIHFEPTGHVRECRWNGMEDGRSDWEKMRDRMPFIAKPAARQFPMHRL